MGIEIDVELLGLRPGMAEPKDKDAQEDLFKRAEYALEYTTGHCPSKRPGSTDCNIPFSMGISTVCFGLINGYKAHTREEYLETDSMPKGFKTAILFVEHYFE